MTLARKISSLLVALDGGYELKLYSGHTVAMAENDEPGLVMFDADMKPKPELLQVGSELVYGMIVEHARRINEDDIELIEESFR